jgi:MoaA/NifB/PqqE/SkfB family radical SAM enzyme
LPYSRVKKLIDEVKELGIEYVQLSGGGEPLQYPKIKELLRYIAKKKLKLIFTTNAKYFNDEIFKIIKHIEIPFIYIPLWAPEAKLFAKVHGTDEKEFYHRLRIIKKLIKLQIQVRIGFVIIPENYNKIYETAKLSKKLGASFFCARKASTSKLDRLLTKKQKAEVKNQMERIQVELADSNFFVVPRVYNYSYNRPQNIKYCKYLLKTIIVGCNGKVYPCVVFDYYPQHDFGNILNTSLREILFGVKRKNFLRNFVCKIPYCTLLNPEPDENLREWLESYPKSF